MKIRGAILTAVVVSLTGTALAIDKTEVDSRIRNLETKLGILQAKPDKRIPAEELRKAQGIVLLDRTKGGFLFAYEGGSGLAMVKDPQTGKWSAPAFLKASEASLGFQIGGRQSFVVLLLMNTNIIDSLTESGFKVGGEASGTAGDASGGVEGTISSTEPLYLVYTDASGFYGGVSFKGGAISADTNANIAYYNQFLTNKEILFDGKAKPGPIAIELADRLDEYSKQ